MCNRTSCRAGLHRRLAWLASRRCHCARDHGLRTGKQDSAAEANHCWAAKSAPGSRRIQSRPLRRTQRRPNHLLPRGGSGPRRLCKHPAPRICCRRRTAARVPDAGAIVVMNAFSHISNSLDVPSGSSLVSKAQSPQYQRPSATCSARSSELLNSRQLSNPIEAGSWQERRCYGCPAALSHQRGTNGLP